MRLIESPYMLKIRSNSVVDKSVCVDRACALLLGTFVNGTGDFMVGGNWRWSPAYGMHARETSCADDDEPWEAIITRIAFFPLSKAIQHSAATAEI